MKSIKSLAFCLLITTAPYVFSMETCPLLSKQTERSTYNASSSASRSQLISLLTIPTPTLNEINEINAVAMSSNPEKTALEQYQSAFKAQTKIHSPFTAIIAKKIIALEAYIKAGVPLRTSSNHQSVENGLSALTVAIATDYNDGIDILCKYPAAITALKQSETLPFHQAMAQCKLETLVHFCEQINQYADTTKHLLFSAVYITFKDRSTEDKTAFLNFKFIHDTLRYGNLYDYSSLRIDVHDRHLKNLSSNILNHYAQSTNIKSLPKEPYKLAQECQLAMLVKRWSYEKARRGAKSKTDEIAPLIEKYGISLNYDDHKDLCDSLHFLAFMSTDSNLLKALKARNIPQPDLITRSFMLKYFLLPSVFTHDTEDEQVPKTISAFLANEQSDIITLSVDKSTIIPPMLSMYATETILTNCKQHSPLEIALTYPTHYSAKIITLFKEHGLVKTNNEWLTELKNIDIYDRYFSTDNDSQYRTFLQKTYAILAANPELVLDQETADKLASTLTTHRTSGPKKTIGSFIDQRIWDTTSLESFIDWRIWDKTSGKFYTGSKLAVKVRSFLTHLISSPQETDNTQSQQNNIQSGDDMV